MEKNIKEFISLTSWAGKKNLVIFWNYDILRKVFYFSKWLYTHEKYKDLPERRESSNKITRGEMLEQYMIVSEILQSESSWKRV